MTGNHAEYGLSSDLKARAFIGSSRLAPYVYV